MQNRIKWLVYPKFQISLMLYNSLIMICVFGVNLISVYKTMNEFTVLGSAIKLPADHPYYKLIDFQANNLYFSFFISFFVSLIISNLITLFLSHRLSGPIIRVKKYLTTVSHNRKVGSKLVFRKNDYFSDLPEVINSALQSIQEKHK